MPPFDISPALKNLSPIKATYRLEDMFNYLSDRAAASRIDAKRPETAEEGYFGSPAAFARGDEKLCRAAMEKVHKLMTVGKATITLDTARDIPRQIIDDPRLDIA